MTRIKVAVLRGGETPAYQDSLKTGSYVLSLLNAMPDEYEPLDVFISRDGEWHLSGLVEEPRHILSRADVAWNAIHGDFGEDGEVQKIFERTKTPFTGSGIAASALTHNKDLTKNVYRLHDISTPSGLLVTEDTFSDEELIKIFRELMFPVVVKPATGVRALGVKLAHTFHELKEAVKSTFKHSPKVLVEEYVRGTVSTCTVIENAKGEALYALVPAHLETHHRRVRPLPEQNRKMTEMAKKAHEALGLRHYSSSDFVVTPRGNIYILETNSQPLFHEDSMFHRSLDASGWKPRDFVDHSIKLALDNL